MTKIDIYSGFLGAGKTTLIKKMIKEAYHGQKLVLIENEFGEIGIDAGRLDQDAVGRILRNDLLERAAEIAHQRAADAAGVHLRDLDAGLLQKAAVNADLAELILDQDELLAVIGLLDHLFDQSRFARAEKAGININFRHKNTLYVNFFL